MNWLKKLFKKKEKKTEELVKTNYKFVFRKQLPSDFYKYVEDASEMPSVSISDYKEYILASDICKHLKTKGTKYYYAEYNGKINEYGTEKYTDLKLYLRCRYRTDKDRNINRESIYDLLYSLPDGICSDTKVLPEKIDNRYSYNTKLLVTTVNVVTLLQSHIDYILKDRDEASRYIYTYYSFKLKDKNNEDVEGYLLVRNYDSLNQLLSILL